MTKMTTSLPEGERQLKPKVPKLLAVPLKKLLVADNATHAAIHFADDVYSEAVQSQVSLLRPPIVSKNTEGNYWVIGNARTAQWLIHQARLSGKTAVKVNVVVIEGDTLTELAECIEHQLLPMALEITSTRSRRKLRASIKKTHRNLLPKPSNKTETLSPISGKNHR